MATNTQKLVTLGLVFICPDIQRDMPSRPKNAVVQLQSLRLLHQSLTNLQTMQLQYCH